MMIKVKSQKSKVRSTLRLRSGQATQNVKLFKLTQGLAFVVWVVYHGVRLCVGLVIHPYRTMREIMRGRWFVPLVSVPAALLIWIFVTGRIAAWAVDVPFALRDWIGIFYATLLISLGLWQALLFYLAFRFWVGLRR